MAVAREIGREFAGRKRERFYPRLTSSTTRSRKPRAVSQDAEQRR